MRDPKQIGAKPRPWTLPRLQRAIGNQALDRIINPPPPQVIEEVEEEPPPPVEPSRAAFAVPPWLWAAVGAIVGAGLGYLIEQTALAPFAGPSLGAALGLGALLRPRND